MIDFLGEGLRPLCARIARTGGGSSQRGVGPGSPGAIPVPPGTRDAIPSVGLLGASGLLEVDGLTIDLVPVGGTRSTNLVYNGDFELGDPTPFAWNPRRRACARSRVSSPIPPSNCSGELPGLGRSGSTIESLASLARRCGQGSRCKVYEGQGGRLPVLFLDENGAQVGGLGEGANLFRWAGDLRPGGSPERSCRFPRRDSGGPPVRQDGR